MKIVAVSDTHTMYDNLIIPDGDVFIHAGDIDLNTQRDAIRFNKWLGELPHKYKIVIGGNHDRWLAQASTGMKQSLLSNCNYLENYSVTIEGIKFWGSPITPMFNNWYFMRERGDEIAKIWEQIPEDIDVLITHGPPYKILDAAPKGLWVQYVGCWDLNHYVSKVKPKIHIFGHVHFSHGTELTGKTKFYNVSVMDEEYNVVHQPTQLIINKGDTI